MSKDRNSASAESQQETPVVVPRWVIEELREQKRLDSWRPRVRKMLAYGVSDETIRDIVGASETEFYSFFHEELLEGYDVD